MSNVHFVGEDYPVTEDIKKILNPNLITQWKVIGTYIYEKTNLKKDLLHNLKNIILPLRPMTVYSTYSI